MKKYLISAVVALAIGGCAVPDIFNENGNGAQASNVKDENMIPTSQRAADSLMGQAAYLQKDLRPILITSIADITNLNQSSAFGLMASEQVGDRFAQMGFPVVDLRMRKDLAVREKSGEFMLSRDLQNIAKKHAAEAVLLGTYSTGVNTVYVSVRLVRVADNRILASYSYELPMGPDVRKMTRRRVR